MEINKTQDGMLAKLTYEKLDINGGVYILPDIDPKIEGAIWNNNGVIEISSGN